LLPVPGVKEAVNPKVASLAHRAYMRGYQADWVTGAEVGYGEPDLAPGPLRLVAVALNAAAYLWVGSVHAALAATLAASACAKYAYADGKLFPSGRVVFRRHGH